MPNWKKVITSGSSAHLNQITASGAISSSTGTSEFLNIVTTKFKLRRPGTTAAIENVIDHPTRSDDGDIQFIIPGDISASADFFGVSASLSGHISASEANFANSVSVNDTLMLFEEAGRQNFGLSSKVNRYLSTEHQFFNSSTELATINQTGLNVVGHITASGEVSASEVRTDVVQVGDGDNRGTLSTTTEGIRIRAGNVAANISHLSVAKGNTSDNSAGRTYLNRAPGSAIESDKELTVEGSISASGTLTLEGSLKLNSKAGQDIDLSDTSQIDFGRFGSATKINSQNDGDLQIDADANLELRPDGNLLIAKGTSYFASFADGDSLRVSGIISASNGFFIGNETPGYFISASNNIIEVSGSGEAILELQGNLTASGNISSSGTITATRYDIGGSGKFASVGDGAFDIGQGGGASLNLTNITASGNISASGTITGNEFIGGSTQNTGSYDFPGAIMGYNAQGVNVADASYNLTTSYAVPDAGFNVCFVAPKSGNVEIEVQIYVDGGSSGNANFFLGLSDNSSYNAVQSYYEVGVYQTLRFAHDLVKNNWVVTGLTPGTSYKYYLGAKISSTSGTPKLHWGANTNNEFPPFIMKATALPSNADIES